MQLFYIISIISIGCVLGFPLHQKKTKLVEEEDACDGKGNGATQAITDCVPNAMYNMGTCTCDCIDGFSGDGSLSGTGCTATEAATEAPKAREYVLGNACEGDECGCPDGYLPTPTQPDVSAEESREFCEEGAKSLGLWQSQRVRKREDILISSKTARPKGCYISCSANKLYIGKNGKDKYPRKLTESREGAEPNYYDIDVDSCATYSRLHICYR